MTEAGMNHFQTVKESLFSGRRELDEQTFASVAVLRERLERVKGLGGAFSRVAFSQGLEELIGRRSALPVG